MKGTLIYRERRLMDGFRECRVSVDGAREIFSAAREFHNHHRLSDQFRGSGTKDMHPENTIGLLIADDLDQPRGFPKGAGATAGEEGKSPRLAVVPFCLQALLAFADP